MIKPYFKMTDVLIHIGYPKTGSTLLQDYFQQHSDITTKRFAFDDYKKTGEISMELSEVTCDGKYFVLSEEQFSVWKGNLNIVGAKFCNYNIKAHQEKVARKLYSAFPKAKILIVTRGFASAFHSMHSQYVSIGGIYSFEKTIEKYNTVFAEFYDYDYLISLYRKIFGDGQVIILPYELMNANLTGFLMQLETKCGIPHCRFPEKKINPSLKSSQLFVFRNLSALVCRLIRPLPTQMQENIYNQYVCLLQRNRKTIFGSTFSSAGLKRKLTYDVMKVFSGKAEILKLEPAYEPYLDEYIF